MKRTVLFAIVLALAAMAVEPIGWLVAGKPNMWTHRQAGFVIGIAPFAIGACFGAIALLMVHRKPRA